MYFNTGDILTQKLVGGYELGGSRTQLYLLLPPSLLSILHSFSPGGGLNFLEMIGDIILSLFLLSVLFVLDLIILEIRGDISNVPFLLTILLIPSLNLVPNFVY